MLINYEYDIYTIYGMFSSCPHVHTVDCRCRSNQWGRSRTAQSASPGESAVDTDSGLQLGDCCGILGISNMFERFRRAGLGQVLADLV